jgi:biotin carboxylase
VGIRQPGYRVIRTKVEAQRAGVELGFPCVVKAPASSGSRGVVKVNDIAEMPMAFEEAIRYAPEGDLLVEEYVRGTELGAQTFSYEGRCQLVLLHNDTVSEPPYMVPTGHSFPVGFDHETRVKVEEMVARCIEVVGIGVGPANIDLIVDEAGEVQILEIGVRIGATCLPELVQCFTGIDWVKETLRAAVGERPDLRVRRIQPCAASILYAKKDGVLVAARVPQEVLGLAGVLEVEVTAHAGDAVSRLRKGTDRIGKVMVQGRSASEAEILASRVFDLIEFEVATNPTAEES